MKRIDQTDSVKEENENGVKLFTSNVLISGEKKKFFSLQLHLVHWNCESHASFKDAVGAGDPNGLCVLGFFLKVKQDLSIVYKDN